MHISFALFADAANLSQEGKLNILGVFDAVHVGTLPTVHPRATLVVRLKGSRADIGRHTLGLSWTSPQGAELWSSTGEIDVAPPPPAVMEMDLPLIVSIDLPIDQAGAYLLSIVLDKEPRAQLALQVRTSAPVAPVSGMMS